MRVIEEGRFDPSDFSAELAEAATNHEVGSKLLFDNDRVRVWEVRLEPGDRCSFHSHTHPYFWTCVSEGTGRQRSSDGAIRTGRYEVGQTYFSEHSVADPLVHDLENVGETVLRFVTVELLRDR
jgi:quercetin dioxygenase-like cupin family protein